jgi:methionine-rich copper-binding protein CopC
MRQSFIVVAMLTLLGTTAAQAHAMLDRADPRVGNTVRTAPHEVSLWFTQDIEPAFSTVTVTDGAGQRVDTGKPHVSGKVMSVPVRAAGPGTYRVNWRVVSVDSHTTEGNFTFRVGE